MQRSQHQKKILRQSLNGSASWNINRENTKLFFKNVWILLFFASAPARRRMPRLPTIDSNFLNGQSFVLYIKQPSQISYERQCELVKSGTYCIIELQNSSGILTLPLRADTEFCFGNLTSITAQFDRDLKLPSLVRVSYATILMQFMADSITSAFTLLQDCTDLRNEWLFWNGSW